jgi:hypothetical protein
LTNAILVILFELQRTTRLRILLLLLQVQLGDGFVVKLMVIQARSREKVCTTMLLTKTKIRGGG